MRSPSALMLTMCYWPEPTGIAPMATGLAEWLSGMGWKVTVVTGFPLMPDWEIYSGYRHKLYQRQIRNNTEIFRSWVYCPARSKTGLMKTWKRIVFDTTLVLTASLTLLSRKPPDVIVAIGPPLQTGFASLFLKKLWRCPVLYWMQDIVPDAAVNVGMMRDGLGLKLARRMESAVYSGADQIGIISEGFRQNLRSKNVPLHKQAFLPNWADVSLFDKTPRDDGLRTSLGIGADGFVIMHAGSMGAKQSLENVLRAFQLMKAGGSVHLVFLGGGNCAHTIKAEAERMRLERVVFLPLMEEAAYINALRSADVLLINQAGSIVDALIPSRLLTYLLAERPVMAAVNGASETAKFIERAGCGWIVQPDSPEALAAAILRLKQDANARKRMGAAGAAFIRGQYDKKVLLERFAAVLTRMVVSRLHTAPDSVGALSPEKYS